MEGVFERIMESIILLRLIMLFISDLALCSSFFAKASISSGVFAIQSPRESPTMGQPASLKLRITWYILRIFRSSLPIKECFFKISAMVRMYDSASIRIV